MSWMKSLAGRAARGGHLEMDSRAGTFCTPKACSLRGQHRNLDDGSLDSNVLSWTEPDFLLILPLQILNPNSDTREEDELNAAARYFRKK